MSTTQIMNITDLVKAARDLVSSEPIRNFWWRGVARNWEQGNLLPGVYRKNRNHKYEREVQSYFMAKARTRYPNCPPEDDLDGWLYLMQHYRLPTRLLDWTESPLIAAFFAVKDEPEHNATLWALNPSRLDIIQGIMMNGKFDQKLVDFKRRSAFERAFMDDVPDYPVAESALSVRPKEIDVRMLVQCSVFTIHDCAIPLEKFKDAGQFLQEFTIPKAAKAMLKEELHSIGIRLDSVFPDLEHLGEFLTDFTDVKPPPPPGELLPI